MISKKVHLSLPEEEVAKFDMLRNELGMNRARYVSDYPMETLEEMLSAMPFVLIHMSRFSIDEIVEIEGWDAKAGKLIFHEVYRKEQGN